MTGSMTGSMDGRATTFTAALAWVSLLLLAPACRDDGGPQADGGSSGTTSAAPSGPSDSADSTGSTADTGDSSDDGEPAECAPASEAPVPEPLLWKRLDGFEADLRQALVLTPAEVCTEVGVLPCRDVHRLPLGANEAFNLNLYRPVAEPLATTPIAMERMVMAACIRRVALDAGGAPEVFTAIDLNGPGLDPSDEAVEEQISLLYRRLLSREPTSEEVEIIAALAQDTTPQQFGTLACFAIGTTTEAATF
ncbi:MAG: hypothetical protein AAGF11_07815 [Myxococcota bacterium]